MLLLAKIFIAFNTFGFSEKLIKCLAVVDLKCDEIPKHFVPYLIAAEDHRSHYHYGVDPIAILRAVFIILRKKPVQGASTIEQQFIRVVTGSYEISLRRKIMEQMLAIALTRHRSKAKTATAYLAIAYYGNNFEGTKGLNKIICGKIQYATETEICSAIARLKYPEPSVFSATWEKKHFDRVLYIKSRIR